MDGPACYNDTNQKDMRNTVDDGGVNISVSAVSGMLHEHTIDE